MQDTVLVTNNVREIHSPQDLHSFVRAFNELPSSVIHGLATASYRVSQMSPKERLELTQKAKRCLGCLSSSERELLREIAREEKAG